MTDKVGADTLFFNVFISAEEHQVNETPSLLIYLRCDANPVAANPALRFSTNYFLSLSNPFVPGRKTRIESF